MKPIQLVELGFLGVFIVLSGFFSASETALLSVSKVKVRHDVQNGDQKAVKVSNLLKSPSKLLTTILIGNNVVNIASSALATTLALEFFGAQGPWIATLGMTLIVLVFGEITPKTYATQNSEKVSYWLAPYLSFLSKIFWPLVKVLVKLTNVVIRLMGGDPQQQRPFITEDEIIRFVTVGEEEGVIEEEEKEMIHSIFEFDDLIVRELMVPRIDIVGVDVDTPLDEVLELIINKGHSRIPVYRDTVDKIIGIIYAKDLLKFIKEDIGDYTVEDLIRPAYYVPESKKVNQLLTELRHEKIHMAILLDEYGGTAGIVTIEDLIEEIVGDIQDEYDFEEVDYIFLKENELVVDAGMPVDEFNDLLNLSLPEEDFDTVGGLVLSILGHVPVLNESLVYDSVKIQVKEMVDHRIMKLHIILNQPEEFDVIMEED